MKLLKGFLIAFTGLFMLISLISLLMPSTVVTIRSEIIPSRPETILENILDLNKWREWHPVFIDSSLEVKVENGKQYTQWMSAGKLNKFIIVNREQNGLRIDLQRNGENDVINYITMNMVDSQPQVEWRAVSKVKWYPWEKFAGIFINEMTGPGYEQALQSLKTFIISK